MELARQRASVVISGFFDFTDVHFVLFYKGCKGGSGGVGPVFSGIDVALAEGNFFMI